MDPWNINYPPGVRCEPCSARSPVSIFHPEGRPCDKLLSFKPVAPPPDAAEWVPAEQLDALLGVGDTLVEPSVEFIGGDT
jgi:hypothetical protein